MKTFRDYYDSLDDVQKKGLREASGLQQHHFYRILRGENEPLSGVFYRLNKHDPAITIQMMMDNLRKERNDE